MDVRLRDLLAQFPDHPLLQQLRTIVQRLLSMQLSSPLKAALTGLELLLSRAQVRLGGRKVYDSSHQGSCLQIIDG